MMKTSLRLAALAAVALVSLPAYADMTVKEFRWLYGARIAQWLARRKARWGVN